MGIVKYVLGWILSIIGLTLLVKLVLIGPLEIFAFIAEYEALQRLVIYTIAIVTGVGGPYLAIRGLIEST